MDIEEWKPPPQSVAPHSLPVSRAKVIVCYSLAGIGVFLVTLAVIGRHEIGDTMAQHFKRAETLRLAAIPARPPPQASAPHIVAAQDLRPLPPGMTQDVNPVALHPLTPAEHSPTLP